MICISVNDNTKYFDIGNGNFILLLLLLLNTFKTRLKSAWRRIAGVFSQIDGA